MHSYRILKPNIPKTNYLFPFIFIPLFLQVKIFIESHIKLVHFAAICFAIILAITFFITIISLIPQNAIVVLNRQGIEIRDLFIFKTFFYWDEIDSFASRYFGMGLDQQAFFRYLTVLYFQKPQKITPRWKLQTLDCNWVFPYQKYDGIDAGKLAQLLNEWKANNCN